MSDSISVVEIDEFRLDRECIRLPTDYLRYATRAAEAKRDVVEAKNRLSVVEADLGKHIRDMPGKHGLEKVTEGALKEVILTHKDYKQAVQDYNEAVYESSLADAVVSALEIKKRTLTLLVELHGMSYFANPKVSERGREAVNEMGKRATRRPLRDERDR